MRVKSIKIFSEILAVIMLFGSFTALAAEREVVASGTSGKVTWTLYSDGEMYIGGNGNITSGFTAHYTKIKKLTIGKDITCSDSYDFDGNYTGFINLETIVVEEGNKSFVTDENGVLLSKNKTKIYLFPAASNLTGYYIPDTVTTVCSIAFGTTQNLKSVTGGKNVSVIDAKAFYYNKSIEEVSLSTENLEEIKNYAFFMSENLKTFNVAGGTTSVSYNSFSGCVSLESVVFDRGGISYIAGWTFEGCSSLKEISLSEELSFIGEKSFYGCTDLEEIELPDSVTSIGCDTFGNCSSLKTIRLPEGLAHIASGVFKGCSVLESITLHSNLKSISNGAFSNCTSLDSIYYTGTVSDWCSISFTNSSASPFNYVDKFYINDMLVTDAVIPDGLTKINDYTFYNYKSLQSITIPDTVTHIGASAFEGTSNLLDIKVSNKLEYIGKNAFYNTGFYKDPANWDNGLLYLNSNLIAVDKEKLNPDCRLYTKTKLIASHVFYKCFDINAITIPESTEYINDYAFFDCDGLTNVTIPEKVKHIGNAAFYGCTNLKRITFNEGLKEIGDDAFLSCVSLQEINIPSSVTVIGEGAFANCTAVKEVKLNDGLDRIPKQAFEGDTNLNQLEIPGTVTSIDPTAFSGSGITDIYYGDNKAQWKRATGGESFDGITVHYTLKSDDESVIIQHTDDNFTWEAGNVHLKVEDLTNVTTSYEQNGFYNRLLTNPIQVLDIKLVDGDDNPIQPLSDENITVKIKASDEFMAMLKTALSSVGEYDIAADKIDFVDDSFVFEVDGETVTVPAAEKFLKSFKVIHWKSDAVLPTDHESFTHDMLSVKNGYIVLQTNHFSEYAVCTDMLEIEQTELEIENGKTAQLNVTVGEGETVTYTSSDENVAKVDSNGVVTAVGPGTATITATVNGTGVSAKCTVNVLFRTFTVKWVVDGVVTEQEITEQSPLTAPAGVPEKAGYIFEGWSPAIPDTMPAKNLTFTAVFEAAPVAELEIITAPAKTAYTYKSGNIDLSGIKLKVTYEDGYSETVTDTSKMTVSGFDSKKVGNQTVTVEYAGATAEFRVGVSYAWWQWIIRIILLGIFWY